MRARLLILGVSHVIVRLIQQRLQGPTSLAIEANVVDFVLGKAKVNEKALSFDEVMGAQA